MQNWLESNRLTASIQFEEDILSKYKEGDLKGFKSAIEKYYIA
jgi:hypothetical protein